MQKNYFLLPLVLSLFFLVSCNSEKKENVETSKATEEKEVAGSDEASTEGTYTIDKSKSTIQWTGYKFDVKSHTGLVDIESGSFNVEDGQVQSGSFTIDMHTIREKDNPDKEKREKLESHLKNEDFFEVETYPTAKFEITGVEEMEDSVNTHEVSGNLTIKETTKNVSFPAKIEVNENNIQAYAELRIDRAEWDVRYGSNTFFDNLGDKALSNEVDFVIDVTATNNIVK